ncbi:MAG: hypothetical protein WCJ30_21005 [Deltaproteobacteria bacterium]
MSLSLPAQHTHATPAAQPQELGFLQDLLRHPAAFLERLRSDDAATLVRHLVLTVVLAAGAFGAVVGAYRGGVQVAYCAVKVPLVLLVTLVVCTPAFVGIARACGSRLTGRDVVALTLGASARFALVLAGMAPVVWLSNGWLGYHDATLGIVAVAAIAGFAGAALLFRGLRAGGGQGTRAGLAFIAVFAAVGGQASWMLRPYLVRPRTAHVPIVRAIEGDLADAVRSSVLSSAGIYERRDAARVAPAPVSAPPSLEGARCEGPSCE